jgi:hypothetical protein
MIFTFPIIYYFWKAMAAADGFESGLNGQEVNGSGARFSLEK